MAPRSSSSRFFILLLAALTLAPVPVGAKGTAKQETTEGGRSLARQNAEYRRLLKLASAKRFYLLLNPERKAIRFMYQGNVLYELPVDKVEVGARRGIFGRGSLPPGWQDSVWTEGVLEPPRVGRMVVLDTADEDYMEQREAHLIPPTPEEAFPAPSRWEIRYKEGLGLEVDSPDAGKGQSRGFFRSLGEWFGGLFRRAGSGGDGVRVRVLLKGKDADFFYRAVPSTTGFALSRWP